MPPVTILNDCALAALRKLPPDSIDCIVTSPPYWNLRDYQIPPTAWPACSYRPMPGLDPIEVPAETSCLGLEPTLHAFLAHLVLIFDECRRVLKPTGSAWVNMGDGYASTGGHSDKQCNDRRGALNIANRPEHEHREFRAKDCLKPKDLFGQPWRVAFALQASGWWLRQDNIWHKPNPMPESIRDRATKAHEYVFHLTKSERYFFDLEAWSEPVESGPSDIRKMLEAKDRIGGKHKELVDPLSKASSTTNIGQKRSVGDGIKRNKRSVWTIATVPYSEAHYATYPPRLITPPILASTSAKGCCSQCGKPWERVVEKTLMPTAKGCKKQVQDSRDARADTQDQGSNRQKDGHMPGWANHTTTKGWQPTCQCSVSSSPSLRVSPSIILDPFGGSGTTAQVALEHGRHAILIERGPHNVELIHKRLAPFLSAPVLNLH